MSFHELLSIPFNRIVNPLSSPSSFYTLASLVTSCFSPHLGSLTSISGFQDDDGCGCGELEEVLVKAVKLGLLRCLSQNRKTRFTEMP